MFRKKGDATSAPVETMISKECELLGSIAAKGSLRIDSVKECSQKPSRSEIAKRFYSTVVEFR